MDCARSNDVLERSEVGAFTMGQEAGSVSEPQERAPSAILFLPTGVSTIEHDLALQLDATQRRRVADDKLKRLDVDSPGPLRPGLGVE